MQEDLSELSSYSDTLQKLEDIYISPGDAHPSFKMILFQICQKARAGIILNDEECLLVKHMITPTRKRKEDPND